MEMYGFARAGVPGEYSPTCVAAALTTDVTNAASYKTLLTKQVTVLEQGESLLLVGSLVSETTVSGGTALVRFSVDGVGFESAGKTVSAAGFKANPRRVQVVEGLIPVRTQSRSIGRKPRQAPSMQRRYRRAIMRYCSVSAAERIAPAKWTASRKQAGR